MKKQRFRSVAQLKQRVRDWISSLSSQVRLPKKANQTGQASARTGGARLQARPAGFWKKTFRLFSLLAAAGILSVPVSAFFAWIQEEPPTIISQVSCEVAKSAGNASSLPLDLTQRITISLDEKLLCGAEIDGGDFVVWRGGGNGFQMKFGPIRSQQEIGISERVRQLFETSNRSQITACSSDVEAVSSTTFIPKCRHLFEFSTPGEHLLAIRVYKRGSAHVEEVSLPLTVVDAPTSIAIKNIQIIPPAEKRSLTRTGSISETLNAPANLFAPPREETRPVLVFPLKAGETVDPTGIVTSVKSSNGASVTFQSSASGLIALVRLRSGPGTNKERAWFTAEVSAPVKASAALVPIDVGAFSLRVPSRRTIYLEAVPSDGTFRITFDDGKSTDVKLNERTAVPEKKLSFQLTKTDGGLVADVAFAN